MLEIREAWRPLKLLGAHAQEDRDDERHPHQAVAYAIERHHRRHRPVISLAEQKEKNDVGRGTEHDGHHQRGHRHPIEADVGIRPPTLAAQLRCDERSEEHTSELQSLMRISYAVFCLKQKNTTKAD